MSDSKNDVFDFLKTAGTYHIASVDSEGKPHVRPFGSKQLIDDKLYISCSLPKKVHEQLSAQKWFEISAMGKGSEWIRIEGTAREVTDPDEKQKIYEQSLYVKGGAMAREVTQVAFFELVDVTAWIFGKEPKEYKW